MKNILDLFAEATGLVEGKTFCYTQKGGSGSCGLCIVDNGEIYELGKFSYKAFIRNEFRDLTDDASLLMINKFVEMAVNHMNDRSSPKPPSLCGNYLFNVKEYQDLVVLPKVYIDAAKDYFKKKGEI